MAITSLTDISDCILWLKAGTDLFQNSDGTTAAAAGDPVGYWGDQSGAGNHSTQGTTASKAIRRASVENGEDSVQADGIDDFLPTGVTDALTDFTCYVVYKDPDTNATAYERILDKDFATGFWLGRENKVFDKWGGGVRETSNPFGRYMTTLTDNVTHILASIRSGTSHEIRGDGASGATGTVTSAALSTNTLTLFAEDGGSGAHSDVHILEVVLYSRALNSTEIADVEAYLDATFFGAGRPTAGGGGATVSAALTLGGLSATGAVEREAALQGALQLAQLAASGTLTREADVSGALTLGPLSVSGAIGGVTAIEAALTLGQLSASGALSREAQLSAALTLGRLSITGDVDRLAALSGALTLGSLSITGTIGTPALEVSGALTLGSLSASGTLTREAVLEAALTLARLGATGTVTREAAISAALTLGQLRLAGQLGESAVLKSLELTLADAITLSPSLTDALTLSPSLTDALTLSPTLAD